MAEEKKRRRRRSTSTKEEPTEPKKTRSRTRPRVEDTDASKNKPAKERVINQRTVAVEEGVLMGDNGLPMIKVINQGAETVPVAQYANVIVGPVAVERWVHDPGIDKLVGTSPDDYTEEQEGIAQRMKEEFATGQNLLEEVIAEDRELIEESIRKQNEEEEKKSK